MTLCALAYLSDVWIQARFVLLVDRICTLWFVPAGQLEAWLEGAVLAQYEALNDHEIPKLVTFLKVCTTCGPVQVVYCSVVVGAERG